MKPKLTNAIFLVALIISSACSRMTDEQQLEWARGQEVYIANCLSCHGADGKGLGGTYPSLTRTEITPDFTARTRYLIENGSPNAGGMWPISISKKETVEVINYIQNAWGNKADFETLQSSTQLSTN
ncbi:Cytochrome C oxidase, cbb3-type, subunit III [Reichenbachiella faecimaris]|uniref:Cytochrome C oxidase, cbb3-type, subunit III n=1 Tax=Reichenbachiella faecimaris TaxID=692418 RepID=A0A1W2G865_REIFA|nr:c-type cytochrome [Reichenbachiella faecimaris]SMD32622.1 Cytochrome C oxidase, cbb3-type, subunit III [Reichenbachiella faecimaris]